MNHEPQTIPANATRTELYAWYVKLSKPHVRQVIKAAIREVNKESKVKTNILTRSLNGKHLNFIFAELGYPSKFKKYEASTEKTNI